MMFPRKNIQRALTAAVLVSALAGCAAPAPWTTPGSMPPSPSPDATQPGMLSAGVPPEEATPIPTGIPDIAAAAARVSPAVVGLAVRTGGEGDPGAVMGLGTGVMADPGGYILTNYHVAGKADEIKVVFFDGGSAEGTAVWSDAVLDLAVVKCEGGPYPAAELGDAKALAAGQPVFTVGTPLDLSFQHTVTAGIVSAVDRALEVPTGQGVSFMEELIQTDAAINPGNSGGPLCDAWGRVVGITTLKVAGAEGLGFAIPINICRTIVEKIARDGAYETPYLGLLAIDRTIARYYGQEVSEGILVLSVDPEGPAYGCGIRQGDSVLAVGGDPVDSMTELREKTYEAGAGAELEIAWKRGERTMTGRCRLIERPK